MLRSDYIGSFERHVIEQNNLFRLNNIIVDNKNKYFFTMRLEIDVTIKNLAINKCNR